MFSMYKWDSHIQNWMAGQSNGKECINGKADYQENDDKMIKPVLSFKDAVGLTERLYGYHDVSCPEELVSYDNQNFLIEAYDPRGTTGRDSGGKERFVLKLTNSVDSTMVAYHEGENAMLQMLNEKGIKCPKPLPNVDGKVMTRETISVTDNGNGRRKTGQFLTRMMEYIPGQPIRSAPSLTMKMAYQAGQLLGRLSRYMQEFEGDVTPFTVKTEHYIWSLTNAPRVREFMAVLTDVSQRTLIEEVLDSFEDKVLRVEGKLRRGFLHCDFSDSNILVRKFQSDPNGVRINRTTNDDNHVIGITDFDDMLYSCIVYEVGVAMMYIMTCRNLASDPLRIGGAVLAGFLRENHLDDLEWDVIYYCVAARFAQSLVFGLKAHESQPQNQYLLNTQVKGWEVLEYLWSQECSELRGLWKNIVAEYNVL